MKSSDLKSKIAPKSNRFTIVTQQHIGQDTSYLVHYPKTYAYLKNHIELFQNRKSSIYRNKPEFSIFGIGNYSFKPYKVAISGLYKTFHFTIVLPHKKKPIMLDDTCYFLGFNDLKSAVAIQSLLNNDLVKAFLQTIAFKDSKRMITKDLLMKIDLKKVLNAIQHEQLIEQANNVFMTLGGVGVIELDDFEYAMNSEIMQLSLL